MALFNWCTDMQTHIIENSVVVNTIRATVAEAQSAFPNSICVDSAAGGKIGDIYDGETFAPPSAEEKTLEEQNAPILAALVEIDRKSIRAIREGNTARIAEFEQQAAALRLQLKK